MADDRMVRTLDPMIHLDQIDLNGDKSTLLVRPSQVAAIEEAHDGGTVLHMVNGLSHIIAGGSFDLAKVLGFDVTGWVRS